MMMMMRVRFYDEDETVSMPMFSVFVYIHPIHFHPTGTNHSDSSHTEKTSNDGEYRDDLRFDDNDKQQVK